jgi:hypothetical protein
MRKTCENWVEYISIFKSTYCLIYDFRPSSIGANWYIGPSETEAMAISLDPSLLI